MSNHLSPHQVLFITPIDITTGTVSVGVCSDHTCALLIVHMLPWLYLLLLSKHVKRTHVCQLMTDHLWNDFWIFRVETLGDPYYKRVPRPRVLEYRNLSQDSQLTKPSVKFAAVEPNMISDYPNGYRKIFRRRRAPITQACEWLSYARYRHNLYLAP